MIRHLKRLLQKKIWLAIILVVAVGGGVAYAKTRTRQEPLRYVLAAVSKGTLITSVSGSGQVSGQNQIDLKPLVSAEVTKILVTSGQSVSTSQILIQLDTKAGQKAVRDATRTVRDAQISLASAELSLRKLQQPPDTVSLIQAENSVKQAERSLEQLREPPDAFDIRQAEADIETQQAQVKISSDGVTPQSIRDTYDDVVPTLKTISQSITQALYSADDVLGVDRTTPNDSYERFLSAQDSMKLEQARTLYQQARTPVRELKTLTEALQQQDEPTENIDAAVRKAQSVLQIMGPLTQSVYDVLQATVSSVALSESTLSGLKSTAQSDHSTIISRLTSLTSVSQSLDSARDAHSVNVRALEKATLNLEKLKKGAEPRDIAAAEERLAEAHASLAKLKRGADPLDISSAQNTIIQRRAAVSDAQNKLHDAQEALEDYTVRAPFDGIIAKITAKEMDQVSASTALATLLTHAKVAQITLNEVDVSKVHVGQKATLTFDALPDLTIAGTVSEVDSIGTVTQGVVNYAVKILFVTQDDRIKPGMSVSASVITDTRVDALVIPNAALNGSFVQVISGISAEQALDPQGVLSPTGPQRVSVQGGLANDQQTEIVSGLTEGQFIVTRVIDPNTQAAGATRTGTGQAAGAAGGLRIPGLGGGGAGGFTGGGGGNFVRQVR